jgi:hypothetical protein
VAVSCNENRPESLPVLTVADTYRLLRDRVYAGTVAEQLLDYLMRIDEVRGLGRLSTP